jgi:RNA polymerase sigma-70 factor (ECF subfamily)
MAVLRAHHDTASPGSPQFTTTHWSEVLAAGQGADESLEKLCRSYWYPLYAYARRQGHGPEDSQDLTQQFFTVFLEKKYFGLANPDRGRFRNFLLASFKHFLANEYHRARTRKRGSAHRFISWDAADTEEHYQREPATNTSPDKLFDQAWVLALLEKVMKELRQEYARTGKGRIFDALQVFLSGEKSETTYKEIGEPLQMGESAVKMAVSRLRQRYGSLLRAEIAHTLTGPERVEEELRHLIGALSG